MRYLVRVKPGSRRNAVIVEGPGQLRVEVTQHSQNNRANEAMFSLLSKYFRLPKLSIRIVRGQHSREKIVSIP